MIYKNAKDTLGLLAIFLVFAIIVSYPWILFISGCIEVYDDTPNYNVGDFWSQKKELDAVTEFMLECFEQESAINGELQCIKFSEINDRELTIKFFYDNGGESVSSTEELDAELASCFNTVLTALDWKKAITVWEDCVVFGNTLSSYVYSRNGEPPATRVNHIAFTLHWYYVEGYGVK